MSNDITYFGNDCATLCPKPPTQFNYETLERNIMQMHVRAQMAEVTEAARKQIKPIKEKEVRPQMRGMIFELYAVRNTYKNTPNHERVCVESQVIAHVTIVAESSEQAKTIFLRGGHIPSEIPADEIEIIARIV